MQLVISMRYSGGNWEPRARNLPALPDGQEPHRVGSHYGFVGGGCHILCVSRDGRLFHTIVGFDLSTTGWGDVFAETGIPPGMRATDVDAAWRTIDVKNGELHIVVAFEDGSLRHSTGNFATRRWTPLDPMPGPGGPARAIACIGMFPGAELLVAHLPTDQNNRSVVFRARVDRGWPEDHVETVPVPEAFGSPSDVGCGGLSAEPLLLVASPGGAASASGGPRNWGRWQLLPVAPEGIGPVERIAGDRGHCCVVTGAGGGTLMHALEVSPSHTWTALNPVPGFGGIAAVDVTCAADDTGGLYVAAVVP